MKIAITGGSRGLGENIKNLLSQNYDIISLNDDINQYKSNICDIIKDCDVFINCGYRDKTQTILFEKVFNDWKYQKKTIINILTSAIVFGGDNHKYIEDKRDLELKTIEVRSDDKEVRIVNVYPNTLENNTRVKNQKLKLLEVSNIIKFIIELPQHIEIFQIGISKTKLKAENYLL